MNTFPFFPVECRQMFLGMEFWLPETLQYFGGQHKTTRVGVFFFFFLWFFFYKTGKISEVALSANSRGLSQMRALKKLWLKMKGIMKIGKKSSSARMERKK